MQVDKTKFGFICKFWANLRVRALPRYLFLGPRRATTRPWQFHNLTTNETLIAWKPTLCSTLIFSQQQFVKTYFGHLCTQDSVTSAKPGPVNLGSMTLRLKPTLTMTPANTIPEMRCSGSRISNFRMKSFALVLTGSHCGEGNSNSPFFI